MPGGILSSLWENSLRNQWVPPEPETVFLGVLGTFPRVAYSTKWALKPGHCQFHYSNRTATPTYNYWLSSTTIDNASSQVTNKRMQEMLSFYPWFCRGEEAWFCSKTSRIVEDDHLMGLGLFAPRTAVPISPFLSAWSASTLHRGQSWGFRENW